MEHKNNNNNNVMLPFEINENGNIQINQNGNVASSIFVQTKEFDIDIAKKILEAFEPKKNKILQHCAVDLNEILSSAISSSVHHLFNGSRDAKSCMQIFKRAFILLQRINQDETQKLFEAILVFINGKFISDIHLKLNNIPILQYIDSVEKFSKKKVFKKEKDEILHFLLDNGINLSSIYIAKMDEKQAPRVLTLISYSHESLQIEKSIYEKLVLIEFSKNYKEITLYFENKYAEISKFLDSQNNETAKKLSTTIQQTQQKPVNYKVNTQVFFHITCDNLKLLIKNNITCDILNTHFCTGQDNLIMNLLFKLDKSENFVTDILSILKKSNAVISTNDFNNIYSYFYLNYIEQVRNIFVLTNSKDYSFIKKESEELADLLNNYEEEQVISFYQECIKNIKKINKKSPAFNITHQFMTILKSLSKHVEALHNFEKIFKLELQTYYQSGLTCGEFESYMLDSEKYNLLTIKHNCSLIFVEVYHLALQRSMKRLGIPPAPVLKSYPIYASLFPKVFKDMLWQNTIFYNINNNDFFGLWTASALFWIQLIAFYDCFYEKENVRRIKEFAHEIGTTYECFEEEFLKKFNQEISIFLKNTNENKLNFRIPYDDSYVDLTTHLLSMNLSGINLVSVLKHLKAEFTVEKSVFKDIPSEIFAYIPENEEEGYFIRRQFLMFGQNAYENYMGSMHSKDLEPSDNNNTKKFQYIECEFHENDGPSTKLMRISALISQFEIKKTLTI